MWRKWEKCTLAFMRQSKDAKLRSAASKTGNGGPSNPPHTVHYCNPAVWQQSHGLLTQIAALKEWDFFVGGNKML